MYNVCCFKAKIGGITRIYILGGNVICLDFWGRKSGAYIHALHFCLSLGLLTGPLLVDPLSSAHVPAVLRKALPFALSHPGSVGNSHIIHKRALDRYMALESSTLDPLLVNIFGGDPIPISTNTGLVQQPYNKKTPKPKPIFNDGQKLDNSRDWEKVKIAQPPIEDLLAPTLDPNANDAITKLLSDDPPEQQPLTKTTKNPTTTMTPTITSSKTTDRSQLIHQELSQVEQDMKQNEKLLNWLNSASARYGFK